MFQRLKDAVAFPSEFSRWEQLSDLRSVLIGNRAAEMFGQSASYGEELDVYRLREIYGRIRQSVVERSKSRGISSQQGAMCLICELGDVYMAETGTKEPPNRLLFCLSMLAPSYSPLRDLLPLQWKCWLEADEEASRVAFAEARAFLPLLQQARREASGTLSELLSGLSSMNAHPSVFVVWAAISSETQETERAIASRAKLPLAEVVACIEAFRQCGVVTIIGTALDEPRYWKTPRSILDEAKLSLCTYLETH